MIASLFRLIIVLCGIGGGTDNATDRGVRAMPTEVLLYDGIRWEGSRPDQHAFYAAINGYNVLQDSLRIFRKPVVTLIDFSKPSSEKRLWVVDIENRKVLLHTWVAHGRNSGELHATRFSNIHSSFQSSLGFYSTGNTYFGKHGLSLILVGLEAGINDEAETRSIVIHGADYVSESFIRATGRLGRSHGCPAVSIDVYRPLINAIQGGSCVFIYHPGTGYFRQSMLFRSRNEEVLSPYASTVKGL